MENINEVNIVQERTIKKNSKASNVLFVLGIVTLIFATILAGLNASLIIQRLSTPENTLGDAFSIVLGLVYFLIPGVIIELISLICSGVSWKLSTIGYSKKNKVLFILSLIVLIVFIVEFLILFI